MKRSSLWKTTAIAVTAGLASMAFTMAPADSKQMARGEAIYKEYCLACHQANGQGLAPVYPPLAKSDWLKKHSKDDFAKIMINGLKGPITVNGKKYNGVMTPIPAKYSDSDIAAVMTYVYNSFGNAGGSVSAADVAKARKASSSSSGSSGGKRKKKK